MSTEPTRRSKIARLPREIREELNSRLENGQPGSVILSWVNGLESTKKILTDYFDGQPINGQNLSEWRAGGFKDWKRYRDQVEETRHLADVSMSLAKASGGQLSEGAAAIAAGSLLVELQSAKKALDDGEQPRFDIGDLVDAITAIRSGDIELRKLEEKRLSRQQRDKTISQNERVIAIKETIAVEKFMKFYADARAKDIMESKAERPVKMKQLVQLMFGAPPEKLPGPSQLSE